MSTAHSPSWCGAPPATQVLGALSRSVRRGRGARRQRRAPPPRPLQDPLAPPSFSLDWFCVLLGLVPAQCPGLWKWAALGAGLGSAGGARGRGSPVFVWESGGCGPAAGAGPTLRRFTQHLHASPDRTVGSPCPAPRPPQLPGLPQPLQNHSRRSVQANWRRPSAAADPAPTPQRGPRRSPGPLRGGASPSGHREAECPLGARSPHLLAQRLGLGTQTGFSASRTGRRVTPRPCAT